MIKREVLSGSEEAEWPLERRISNLDDPGSNPPPQPLAVLGSSIESRSSTAFVK